MLHQRTKFMPFARRLLHFLIGNTLTQALTAVTGLLLVRWLSIEEYAIYTIGTVTTGAVTVLAQGGTDVGFVSILGRYWPNHERVAPLIGALGQARRMLFVFLLPLVIAMVCYLLYQSPASLMESAIIVLLIIAFWIGEMNSKTVDQVLFFAHQTTRVQVLDAAMALVRLVLIAAAFFLGELNAVTALLFASILALLRILPIRAWVYRIVPRTNEATPEADLKEIMVSVRRQLPGYGFMVLQSQIVLFLLASHANAATIAGYGTMLRITALLVPLRRLNSAFYVPIAARAKRHVARTILALAFANAIPGIILIAIGMLFPWALLWLLGPQYAGFEHEMRVTVWTSAFIITGGTFWALVSHRGWVKHAPLQIPLGLLWILVGSFTLDLSTITGGLILNAGFTLPLVILGGLELYLNRHASHEDAQDEQAERS